MNAEISSNSKGFIAYLAVTAAYWSFMLTDGALRMLVLLHFHTLGFSPIQLAYLFVLYEVAGMVTNLAGGWVAAHFGLTSTLFVGLGLQVLALCALTQLDPGWTVNLSVVFVMLVQGASGVAKDLTKMSSKSAVKLLAPKGKGGLFRWVALLTGSKNVVKGCGFLMGAGLLASVGFLWSIVGMASVLGLILMTLLLFMPPGLPRGRKKAKFSEVFSKSFNVNWLSAARIFLFGARDVWFAVGIPLYFYAELSDGSEAGNYKAFFLIGTFMSFWIILYGVVQTMVPKLLQADSCSEQELVGATRNWGLILFLVLVALAVSSFFLQENPFWLTQILVGGLAIFGVVFAVNSSLHSYLILAFTQSERVTMDVGFYYMA
ncbi:MAG: MFS transporter, partial [Deltaproteobacteria bacterium]|nr:MFS transporter [Deltaproteobacteria bacterium]